MRAAAWSLALAACGGAVAPASGPPAAADEAEIVQINELVSDSRLALPDGRRAAGWVELYARGGAPVALDGWTLSVDPDSDVNPDAPAAPLDGLRIEAGGVLLLLLHGDRGEADPSWPPLLLDRSGGLLTLRSPAGGRWSLRHPALAPDTALARRWDGCVGEACWREAPLGSPGLPNGPQAEPAEAFSAEGDPWSYTAGCPAEGWEQPGFDDRAWAEGPSPIGAGEDKLRTYVDLGPEGARTPSFCFRRQIEGRDGLRRLELQLRRDDGAQVFLDGVELLRDVLPPGPLDRGAYALRSLDEAEEAVYRRFVLDPAQLGAGPHTLAVAVHQGSADSGDLAFDLWLRGE